MPNLSDDINQQLQHEAEQKAREKAFDAASDILDAKAEKGRYNDFSFVNPHTEALTFKEYFQEGERREVFGDFAKEMAGDDFPKPIDFNFIGPPPPPENPDFIGPPKPPFIGPPKPPDYDFLYKKYDEELQKAQAKIDKLEVKLEENTESLKRAKTAVKDKVADVPHKKGRLIYEKGQTYTDETGKEVKVSGRLKFKDNGRMTEREYHRMLHKKDVADRHMARRSEKARERTRRLFDDDSIEEDEAAEGVSRRLKTAKRGARLVVQQNVKRIRHTSNDYSRLKMETAKVDARLAKEYALKGGIASIQNDVMKRASSSATMKRKLKKEIVRRRAAEQGNLAFRIKTVMFGWKKRAAVHTMAVKRNIALATSIGGIFFVVILMMMIGFMLLFIALNMSAEIMVKSTTSNTYDDISDATAEFRRLETDLEEFLNPETLEPLLQEENPDKEIYEYIYDLDDFGFSANTLIAYLSVKFQEFNLQEVADEIQSIFDEMYYFHYELVEEPRYLKVGTHLDEETGEMVDDYDWVDVWICYVFLEKTEMEAVVEGRMNAEELEQYKAYKLSTGGQQVYGGIMVEDWTNLISSPFGERIHPITGERTFHNGVDIAIPIGTSLYAAVEGTVTTARYSDTAGNYIVITTEEGWCVKYMHMDSLAVSAGDVIKKGDFVGYSGNTGRSTGPHLHLEVRNPSDLPIDPIFIVPQTAGKQTN